MEPVPLLGIKFLLLQLFVQLRRLLQRVQVAALTLRRLGSDSVDLVGAAMVSEDAIP
jgi:hypothetical protein